MTIEFPLTLVFRVGGKSCEKVPEKWRNRAVAWLFRANCVNNVKLFCVFLEIPIDSTFSPKKDTKIVVLNQFFKLERLRILSREKTVENCRFLFFQDGVLVMVSKVQLTTLLFSLDYTN